MRKTQFTVNANQHRQLDTSRQLPTETLAMFTRTQRERVEPEIRLTEPDATSFK